MRRARTAKEEVVGLNRRTVGILTRNLMDRSRLEAGLAGGGWDTVLLKGGVAPPGVEAVVVDLEHPDAFDAIESSVSTMICLAYGPHVDTAAFERAKSIGVHHALPRSIVFRDMSALAARLEDIG